MNILFVCRANLQRSPTAEELAKEKAGADIEVKSAGVDPNAVTKIDEELLEWADHVYVMTEGLKERIRKRYPKSCERKRIRVLGIEDRYLKGDPELRRRLLKEFSRDDFLCDLVEDGAT